MATIVLIPDIGSCPTWCQGSGGHHGLGDSHFIRAGQVDLSLMADLDGDLLDVSVEVEQTGPGHEPFVSITADGCSESLLMTAEEAEQLGRYLLDGAQEARSIAAAGPPAARIGR